MNEFHEALLELEKVCFEDNKQIFCVLHEPEYLGGHTENSHVCIACNLQSSLDKIYKFLYESHYTEDGKKEINDIDIEYQFTVFILLSNLVVEKLLVIFKCVNYPFKEAVRNWPILFEIKRWANFFKHPKGFLFSHHPKYFYETEIIPIKYQNWAQLDYSNTIEPLYSSSKKEIFNDTLNRFSNKNDLIVIIPSPVRIVKELISVSIDFCSKIKDNENYKNSLKDITHLKDYFFDEFLRDEE